MLGESNVPDEPVSEGVQTLTQALSQLQSALTLLDRAKAPAHIAAHVDLAIHQLGEAIRSATAHSRGASNSEECRTPLIH